MTTRKPKRGLLYKVLMPVLAVFFTLLLLELGLRSIAFFQRGNTAQKQLSKMLRKAHKLYPPPNKLFSQVLDREKLSHKNYPSMGITIRDYEYPVSKPDDTYRIIGLGDSFAWGWGVSDNRRTTFKYLECWLNADDGGQHYEVINCARPARTVRYYETFLKQYGELFGPDMVIVLYNLNDSYIAHASMVVDKRTEAVMRQQKDPWSDISKLYRLIKKRIVKKRVHDYTVKHIKDSYFGHLRQERWEAAQNNIREIQKFCKEKGIELIIVIFPLLFELEKSYPFESEVHEVDQFLKSNHIRTVNLLPTFKGKKTFVLWSSPTDSHPNKVAHRLAAETIYQYLQENVFEETSLSSGEQAAGGR
jgi:hypothetical protein